VAAGGFCMLIRVFLVSQGSFSVALLYPNLFLFFPAFLFNA